MIKTYDNFIIKWLDDYSGWVGVGGGNTTMGSIPNSIETTGNRLLRKLIVDSIFQ